MYIVYSIRLSIYSIYIVWSNYRNSQGSVSRVVCTSMPSCCKSSHPYGFVAFKGRVPPRELRVLMRKIYISTELNGVCCSKLELAIFSGPKGGTQSWRQDWVPRRFGFFWWTNGWDEDVRWLEVGYFFWVPMCSPNKLGWTPAKGQIITDSWTYSFMTDVHMRY